MEVVSAGAHQAVCRGRNGLEQVNTLITGPLEPGQWVLCFLGAAREIIDAERARLVEAALAVLDALASGQGDTAALIDNHFADLVGREPQLPDFLRPPSATEHSS